MIMLASFAPRVSWMLSIAHRSQVVGTWVQLVGSVVAADSHRGRTASELGERRERRQAKDTEDEGTRAGASGRVEGCTDWSENPRVDTVCHCVVLGVTV